jgi:hypothetical protein
MKSFSNASFHQSIFQGNALAEWPMVLPADVDAEHLKEWMNTVRHRLAVVQFQGFLNSLVEHWPAEFVSVKVEVVRNRVLFTTENIPDLSDEKLKVAEKALLNGIAPYTENIDQHFSSMVLDGFGFTPRRRDEVAGVLERALSKHPELVALFKQSQLDTVLPDVPTCRTGPRM